MLNRLVTDSESGTPRPSQIRWASSGWAEPENTTISRMAAAYPRPGAPSAADSSETQLPALLAPDRGGARGSEANPCGTPR